MKVTLRGASVPACKWSWNIGVYKKYIQIQRKTQLIKEKWKFRKKNNNLINQIQWTEEKPKKGDYLPGENPDFLNQITGPKLWANLKIEKPRKEKRLAQMFNQFSDLIDLNRNEPLVASMLPIFLLENDARESAHFSFFGGDAFSGGGAWDG